MKTALSIFTFALTVTTSVHAKLAIVATTTDFGSLAAAVGGKQVSVVTLAKPTEDPHFVDAKPSFILKLNRADAVIEGGGGLEAGWLPALVSRSRNNKLRAGAMGRILCSQGVPMLEVPTTLDRSHGHVHAGGNPHFMTDPANARIVAQHLAQVFAQLDPKSGEVYMKNMMDFLSRLDAKTAEWKSLMAPFKGRRVAAYHNSWPYFARAYGLRIDVFLEPKPGVPPTPAHLERIITRAMTERIGAIMVEPFQNRKTARMVATRTGTPVIDVAQFPGGVKGTEAGYIELMDYVVKALARALSENHP